MPKNKSHKKTAVFLVTAGVLLIFVSVYALIIRGWVGQVKPDENELKKVCEQIEKTSDLKRFENIQKETSFNGVNVSIDCVDYNEAKNTAQLYIYANWSDKPYGSDDTKCDFDTIDIYISEKKNPVYCFENDIVFTEKDYIKAVKKEYGVLDPLYSMFSSKLTSGEYSAYFSPFSRERSEIYSFTGTGVISGIISTDSYVICFNVRTHEGADDAISSLLYFLEYVWGDSLS